MFYVGSTQDIEKRLVRYNDGRSKFTKDKGPWQVVYSGNSKTEQQR